MHSNTLPQAIFGGVLWGDRPMRFVFMDEAGVDATEPVTVVVGIVADADAHVMRAEARVNEIMGAVPTHLRDGFVFSAKKVFSDAKLRDGWSQTDRLHFLKQMMSVPRQIGMAVCVAAEWRCAQPIKMGNLRPDQVNHLLAFGTCVVLCDRGIRYYGRDREVGTIVAEDHEEMRQFLRMAPRIYRENPVYLSKEHLRWTDLDEAAGHLTQTGEMRVTRIRNSVHFVAKSDDPLVQVADACAYAFRRHFAGQSFGGDFVDAVLGSRELVSHFAAPCGGQIFWATKYD